MIGVSSFVRKQQATKHERVVASVCFFGLRRRVKTGYCLPLLDLDLCVSVCAVRRCRSTEQTPTKKKTQSEIHHRMSHILSDSMFAPYLADEIKVVLVKVAVPFRSHHKSAS